MARTRSVVLRAAAGVVAERGTKHASMAGIAAAAGVAKGTLYNHFRTKDDVWSALVAAELGALVEECRGLPLVVALGHAAQRIGVHPAVRRIAADEPTVLATLLDPTGRYWPVARASVASALAAAGREPGGADLVLRWLASHLYAPDPRASVTAEILAVALPYSEAQDGRSHLGAADHAGGPRLPH
jgi:AcrR family transcriptional regulator